MPHDYSLKGSTSLPWNVDNNRFSPKWLMYLYCFVHGIFAAWPLNQDALGPCEKAAIYFPVEIRSQWSTGVSTSSNYRQQLVPGDATIGQMLGRPSSIEKSLSRVIYDDMLCMQPETPSLCFTWEWNLPFLRRISPFLFPASFFH